MALNKRFYDIISVIFIILIVALFIYKVFFFQETSFESGGFGTIFQLLVITLAFFVLTFTYWIFILVLAIKMNSQKLITILEVVIIAILTPFSIFFYVLTLRKHFKKMHKHEIVLYSLF